MDIGEKLREVEGDFFTIRQQLASCADALPEPIFIIDASGRFLNAIGARQRSIYQSGKFLIGKSIHDVLQAPLADTLLQTISAAIADDSLKTVEYQLNPEDIFDSSPDDFKGGRWFEGRFHPIRDKNNEVHSVVWLHINISEKKNLQARLQEMSEKDLLTGACNRRYFLQIFEQEFAIAKRYRTNLSVLLFSIDNLKEINEAYGHEAGDIVLKRFVIFCEENFRKSDLFARYSSKEFIVMLPYTPSLGAAIIAERIRANIEEMAVTFEKQAVSFTVSIGISLVQDSDTSSNAVLSRAEAALYQAKKKGRNRLEIS